MTRVPISSWCACAIIVALGFSVAVTKVFSQDVGPAAMTGTELSFVLPRSRIPLSADLIVELAPKDGVETQGATGKLYRDTTGRTRTEQPVFDGTDITRVVEIRDVGAGQMVILIPSVRKAFRSSFSASGTNAELFHVPSGVSLNSSGQRSVKTESLGNRIIEGIEFEGQLTSVIAHDEPKLTTTDELWYSRDLGLVGLYVIDGPNGKKSYHVKNILRKEPDPSLFAIPPDYQIHDMPRPPAAK
jgi:hypothetical protein